MTGLRVNGELYELDSITDMPLGELFVLKLFTKSKGHPTGVSLKTINAMFDTLRSNSENPDWEPMDLLDDADYLVNMVGFIYCVRRSAGDKVSPADVWDTTTVSSLSFEDDEEAEVADDAPKDESASEPAPNVS